MSIPLVDLTKQYQSIKEEIDAAISQVINSANFIGGSGLSSFEQEFAYYLGVSNFIGVANGTDALEIVLESFNFPKSSEVIVPANTFIADSEAVSRVGYKVIFCDCSDDYLIDYNKIEGLITDKTKAIVAVHLYGLSCDMDRLRLICNKYQLKLIEDCSQAHGAKYNGSSIGSLGDAAVFSFYPGKNLGAYGDAGGIAVNDINLAKQCRMIANHGRLDSKYNHQIEGRNSRLDALQSAVLRVKLKYLDSWIEKKNQLARVYFNNLHDLKSVKLPVLHQHRLHGYHLFVIRADNRDDLRKYLYSKGVETGVHYPMALPTLKAYEHHHLNGGDFANAISYSQEIISLPLYPEMSDEDAIYISREIKNFYDQN